MMHNNTTPNNLLIYTDGGSRGNPGKAACAYTARLSSSTLPISEDSLYLGIATNNVAEYRAIVLALTWLDQLSGINTKQINFYADSLLVVNQINGIYKIKDANLRLLHAQLLDLLKLVRSKGDFAISFNHIPREQNKRADELVNMTLDKV